MLRAPLSGVARLIDTVSAGGAGIGGYIGGRMVYICSAGWRRLNGLVRSMGLGISTLIICIVARRDSKM
jgi:hypothetical protein